MNIHPTFKEAQELFYHYSTLQSDINLKKTLIDVFKINNNDLITKNVREIYNNIILKYYPNETSVKANFFKQILFKQQGHVSVFELPLGNSRADICKINGSSTAYEIKTDLDNLKRLDKQLKDYSDFFENVYVICSLNKLSEIEKQLNPNCGIYTYTISNKGNYRFYLNKIAIKTNNTNSSKQLNFLRKDDLSHFINVERLLGKNEIISLITKQYTNDEINHIFKKILKLKYASQWNFLRNNKKDIFEIDYQWFFKNIIDPKIIYC